MPSPVPNGAFNPSANTLTKTQVSRNSVSSPFPTNSQPLQNITNTNRSVPSPSGNGYTVGSTIDPRINTTIPNSVTAPKTPPINQPQAIQVPSTPVSSPNAAISGVGSIITGYAGAEIGKAVGQKLGGDLGSMYGEAIGSGIAAAAAAGYTTGNPIAAATAGGLVGTGSLLNSVLQAAGQLIGANNDLKKAQNALDNANKRYENALKNRQSAPAFNTQGSGDNTIDYSSVTGWFPVFPDGTVLQLSGAFSTYEAAANYAQIALGNTSNVKAVPASPPTTNSLFAPPLDSPKPKPDPTKSPDYFPYLPSVQISGKAADILDSQLSPSYDNKPQPPLKDAFLDPPVEGTNKPNSLLSQPTPTSSTASNPTTGISNPAKSGFISTPATQTPATQTYANGMTNEDYNKGFKEVDLNPTRNDIPPSQAKNPLTNPIIEPPVNKPQTTPNTPPYPDLGSIALGITGLGLAIGAIATGIDYLKNLNNQINQQTSPTAQQTNAKQGVCDAMQPQQCGYQGVKMATEEATNPIKDIANENKGVLASIAANFAGLVTLITSNFTKLFNFLDLNAKVESVKSTITLALTLHNALMLSQSLGQTLGTILDNVLNVFGNTFRASDGSQISASQYLGATVQQWIINVIGAENYVQLTETLAQANRIYQTGMNILSTVQGIFDAANAAAQATGIKVSLLMNALRDESVVSPQAYPHQDESPLGNRASALQRFTQLTTTVSDLDSKAQNLVTVTAAPITIRDSVKQSKEDIKAFNDARDASSEVNRQAKEAKLDAIKQLKPITEAVISKRDDDT